MSLRRPYGTEKGFEGHAFPTLKRGANKRRAYGAASRTFIVQLVARLKRLRKKSDRKADSAKDGLAGAKARLISLTLSARLKPCPCYKASGAAFFRSL